MDYNTSISYEEVRGDATEIKGCAATMKGIFDDFIATMNVVVADDVFAGNASESLQTKFQALKQRLDSYTRTVEKFSDTILNATDATEYTEQAIQAAAEDMPR